MVKCNSCGTQQEICYINYAESVKRKRNWEKEFLAKKGVVKDNDFKLCSPCQTEIKEFKATEVLKELNQNNLVDTECFPPNYLKASNFTAEGAKKVQKAITENIKRWSREWKIVRAKLLNSDREYYHDWNGDYKNNEQEILIHQSAKIEYGEDRFLKREENKMFLEEYFPSEKWTEIKLKKQYDKYLETDPGNQSRRGSDRTGHIIAISLIAGLISWITYKAIKREISIKKKKKKQCDF